ncbi:MULTISPECIES: hypothetical protein [Pseudomonas]|uniref:hypothetical protein n=1 Tax=Pseudomonas TaxID=286 RepID=UPI0018AAE1DF|nr:MULTISPECIES: hypothetical protein [Pseudomonas]MBF8765827.1 hypothetical protein [Pseudomonas putida]MBH3344905.1 hypothetical protein [Pseudomonas parafulva]MEC4021887.1 hypothetical protein [Pseudomonas fulva]
MLLVLLACLNAVCLLAGLLFNAELLNVAGADIPLKKLQDLEIYSQILASVTVCLTGWRVCIWAHHRWGGEKYLWHSVGAMTLVAAPATWWVQGEAPDLIAEKFPHTLRVSSLYAYVTKKGLLYDSIQIPGLPYQDYREHGEGKAFIANLGILMSAQGTYVEKIDGNFPAFAEAVFKGYTRRNGDALYERLQAEVVPTTLDVIRAYAQLEALRATGIGNSEWKPIRLPKPGEDLGFEPTVAEYAQAIKPGLRSRPQVAQSPEVLYMASQALGPIYVKGMNVLASREQFEKYLPQIARNMATDVAHTDIRGEQGLNVLKNMWFVPWSLLSGLFLGALNLVGLILSACERRGLIRGRQWLLRTVSIAAIVVIPLMAGNALVQSEGYKKAFRSIDRGPTLVAGVFHWAMTAEAMLYNLTKPLLKAE